MIVIDIKVLLYINYNMSEKSNQLYHSDTIYLELQTALDNYVKTLNSIELLTLNVAKRQLESSFELHKSIGFIKYLKENNIYIINN